LNKIEPSSIVYSEENAIALMVGGEYDALEELGCDFHSVVNSNIIQFLRVKQEIPFKKF